MADRPIAQQHHETFEGIRHLDPDGNEFWLARQLAKVSISTQNFPGNSVQKFPVDQVLFTAFLRCLKRNESLPVSRMSQW